MKFKNMEILSEGKIAVPPLERLIFCPALMREVGTGGVMKKINMIAVFLIASFMSFPVHAGLLDFWTDYQGREATQKEEYFQAEEAFKAKIQSNPHPSDYYNLGVTQYKQEKFAEAKENFMAAINSEDPKIREQAYYNLGNALYRLKDLKGAINAYAKALEINPQDGEAARNLEFVKRQLNSQQQNQTQNSKGKGQGEKQESGAQQPGSQGSKQNSQANNQNQGQNSQSKSGQQGGQNQQKQNGQNQSGQDPSQQAAQDSQDQQGQSPQNSKQQDEQSQSAQNEKQQDQNAGGKNNEQEKSEQNTNNQNAQNQNTAQQNPQNADSQNSKNDSGKKEAQKPEDLSGQLTAQGKQAKEKEGQEGKEDSQQGQEAKNEGKEDPLAKIQWLDLVEDHSEEMRKQQINEAMLRSPRPEKDW